MATPVAKVNVHLTEEGKKFLEVAVRVKGGSKTGAIHRALHLYSLVCEAQAQGGGVFIQSTKDDKLKPIYFL